MLRRLLVSDHLLLLLRGGSGRGTCASQTEGLCCGAQSRSHRSRRFEHVRMSHHALVDVEDARNTVALTREVDLTQVNEESTDKRE